MQVFRVRYVLRMTDPARLHAHHAAILYSLLAHAHGVARSGPPCVPDGVLLDAPEQARLWVAKGGTYAFGFTLLAASGREATSLTDLLTRGLRKIGRRQGVAKVALGGNYDVELVQDLVAAETHRPGVPLEPISAEFLQAEITRLAPQPTVTLDFLSPLRAHRPKHARLDGHQFLDREYFAAGPFVRRIIASGGASSRCHWPVSRN